MSDIIDLSIIPAGNAELAINKKTKKSKIVCQHGETGQSDLCLCTCSGTCGADTASWHTRVRGQQDPVVHAEAPGEQPEPSSSLAPSRTHLSSRALRTLLRSR